MKVWSLQQMLIHATSTSVICIKFPGSSINRYCLLNITHRCVIHLTTISLIRIEQTLSKAAHCHLLREQLWSLGPIKHSNIKFDFANQSLGIPMHSLEAGHWAEGRKADCPSVLRMLCATRISDLSGMITTTSQWDGERGWMMWLCLIDGVRLLLPIAHDAKVEALYYYCGNMLG